MTLFSTQVSFRRCIPFLLLCITTGNLCAQSLSLFNVDATNFPQIEGELVALDADGELMTGLNGGDLVITENGMPVSGSVTIDCPAPTGPTPMSAVLVVDRSGSMVVPLPNGETPLDLIRIGTTAFLETLLFTPSTAVALSGFNDQSFLISDFKTSPDPLIKALEGIIPQGGTEYDPPFLNPISGGIQLLSKRPASVRKVLIFISDGEPNSPPSTQTIIDMARGQGIAVYTITIGLGIPDNLREIARQTGGTAYGDVSSSDDLAAILRSIAIISRGASPCKIRWESGTACAQDVPMRIVAVGFPSAGLSAGGSYIVPDEKRIYLEPSVKALWFGTASFPNTPERSVQIIARRGGITITGEEISDPTHFKIVNWGGPPPPFTLNEGERRTITLQFAPTDTTGYAADLVFFGDPCPSGKILLAGGERTPETGRAPLVLQSPVGGESFDGCDVIPIRWGGVAPDQPVRIQYSDDGFAWKTIIDSATGYEYLWNPPGAGENYRIRISTDAIEQNMIFTVAGGGDSLSDGIFGTEAKLIFPWGLDVRDDTLYIAEAGARNRIRMMDLQSNILSTVAGTGAPGNGGDGGEAIRARFSNPVDVLLTDNTIYIADRDNFKIRAVDRKTKIVTTFAGTGAIGFSPDGTRIDTGTIGSPTALATDGTYLYFSEISSVTEPGNNRVRRIDLKTKAISTVAGGGTFYDSDGALASKARLLAPFGLTVREGSIYFAERDAARVRKVDLTSGIITTVAGTGQPGSSGDGGAATSANLNSPTDVLFIENNLYITESTNGHRIRRVNIGTGIISTFAGTGVQDFAGDSGAARNAALNEPTSLAHWEDLLFVSDRGNERLRAITLRRADGLDSSRTPFRVIAPRLRIASGIPGNEVNIGGISIGELKDTVVQGLVCNTGTAPLVLDSARIIGADSADFHIVGGLANVPILPGECRTVAIEFTPSALGRRSAAAIFYGSCSLPDTLQLAGTGLTECALVPLDLVDFGEAKLGATRPDSVVTAVFCNRGTTTISGNARILTPGVPFTIVAGGGPFTLKPNACLTLTIRFRPEESGLTMGIIDYGIPSDCGTAQTLLSGRGLRPQEGAAEGVSISAAECPDNTIDTVVVLRNIGEAPLSVTGLSFAQNDEGFSILSPNPTPGAPLIIPGGGEEKINIRFAPVSAGTKTARLIAETDAAAGSLEVILTGRRDSLALTATASEIIVPRNPSATYPRDTVIALQNTGDRPMMVTGATPTGGDLSFFSIPSGQFPLLIPPGESKEITVQILQPTEDRLYRTDIAVAFEPSCALPAIVVPVIHAGSRPVLSAQSMEVTPLLCDDPVLRDTTITIHNFGGSELRIEEITITDDTEGNFSATAATPIIIPPGGSAEIGIRFRPTSTGIKSGTLRLGTNTENGVENIPLQGERGSVSFTLSQGRVSFDPAPGGPKTATVELRNTGTAAITWSLSSLSPSYTIVSLVPTTAAPGEESILTLRYDGPAEGSPEESLVVGETICGTTERLRLLTDNGSATVEAWLPHDSALFNTRVRVPLRYRLIDGLLPTDIDTFTTTIRFTGTTFFFEGITAGEVIEKKWDAETNQLSVTIKGTFGERNGDTLTYLVATALLAEETFTPLAFEGFAWSRPSIAASTVDGSFKVLGTCLDSGINIGARPPQVERIRPNPASDHAVVEILLPDWAWLRGELIDPQGKRVEIVPGGYLPAGRHELNIDASALPAGIYLLRLETPHGNAEKRMVIVR